MTYDEIREHEERFYNLFITEGYCGKPVTEEVAKRLAINEVDNMVRRLGILTAKKESASS